MSVNITFVQRSSRKNLQGTTPISLRITIDRVCRYVPTGISIPECNWDKSNHRIKAKTKDYLDYQSELNKIEAFWNKRIAKMKACDETITFNALFEDKLSRSSCNIEDYFLQQIHLMRQREQIGTASKYQYCLKLLKECNSVRINFDQIDLPYLRRFESFLMKKGNKNNSIATKFSVLRAVYNKAFSEGMFDVKIDPFKLFKPGRFWEETRKRAITKKDIQKIRQLPLKSDSSPYSLSFARDIFLFSYYVAGINFRDIASLKNKDIVENRLFYRRHKTGKELNYLIRPEVQDILSKYNSEFCNDEEYIFPILNINRHKSQQQIFNRLHKILKEVNSNLSKIAKMAEIDAHLTTYVARHTFATVLKRSGVSIEVISESLGHADITTTQIYLDSFENQQVDEALEKL